MQPTYTYRMTKLTGANIPSTEFTYVQRAGLGVSGTSQPGWVCLSPSLVNPTLNDSVNAFIIG